MSESYLNSTNDRPMNKVTNKDEAHIRADSQGPKTCIFRGYGAAGLIGMRLCCWWQDKYQRMATSMFKTRPRDRRNAGPSMRVHAMNPGLGI